MAAILLNYDLAMTDALGCVSAGDSVSVIADPGAVGELGSSVVVYLHRNVNESNFEKWVLRAEVIDDAWRGGWEEIIAQRIVTSPIVVFAGLGSPAAVLTETVRRIRQSLEGQGHDAFVVDPSTSSPFKETLDLPEGAHIQMGWCAFMQCLADRLIIEQTKKLSAASRLLCTSNGWTDEVAGINELSQLFSERGLVASGFQRASWLLSDRKYLPDQEQVRELIAYLLLGVGIAQRHCNVTVNVRSDCVIELRKGGVVVGSILPISAAGTKHWTAMEPSIRRYLDKFTSYERPTSVLLGSLLGATPTEVSPPPDIVFEDDEANIVSPSSSPVYISVDYLRSYEAIADRFVN